MHPLAALLLARHAQAESIDRLLCRHRQRSACLGGAAQYAVEELVAARLLALVVRVSVCHGELEEVHAVAVQNTDPLSCFHAFALEQGAGDAGGQTEHDPRADSTDEATELKVKTEPGMAEPWCVVPSAPGRAQIASRRSTPYEAQSLADQHGSRPLRRSRIHCPSAL